MKIALITDIHFGARGSSQLFHDNLFRFLEEVFFPHLIEHSIKNVFILGDTWENRKIINFHTLHEAKTRFFDKLEELGIQVKMIYGNHDVYFKNTNEVNSVDLLLAEYDNIEVIETWKSFDFYGRRMGMISWLNSSNMQEGIEWIKRLDVDILFGHFETEIVSDENDAPHKLNAEMFSHIDLVVSGHYHIPSYDGRVVFIGNPSQTNWREYGQNRGFTILDTNRMSLELVKNPFDIFVKYYYNAKEDLLSFDFSIFNKKIVKLYADFLNLKERKKFDLFMDGVSKEAFSLEVIDIDPNLYQDEKELENIENIDTFDTIQQYVNSITADGVSKTKILSLFTEIYKQALEKTT
jgi:DNA repair exonuclease SbcCD nuclease subunit